jgi:hypothetical protein
MIRTKQFQNHLMKYLERELPSYIVWDRNRKNDAKYFSVGHDTCWFMQ